MTAGFTLAPTAAAGAAAPAGLFAGLGAAQAQGGPLAGFEALMAALFAGQAAEAPAPLPGMAPAALKAASDPDGLPIEEPEPAEPAMDLATAAPVAPGSQVSAEAQALAALMATPPIPAPQNSTPPPAQPSGSAALKTPVMPLISADMLVADEAEAPTPQSLDPVQSAPTPASFNTAPPTRTAQTAARAPDPTPQSYASPVAGPRAAPPPPTPAPLAADPAPTSPEPGIAPVETGALASLAAAETAPPPLRQTPGAARQSQARTATAAGPSNPAVSPAQTTSTATVPATSVSGAAGDLSAEPDDLRLASSEAGPAVVDPESKPPSDPMGSPAAEVARNAPPPPAAAAPAAVRGSPETLASLAAQILKKLDSRTTRFDVELHPADLGRVDVRLEIGAQGRITAALSFDNPQAAADLRGRAGDLQQALEKAGFNLSGGITFDVAGDRGGQNLAGQQQQQPQSDGGAHRGRAFMAALESSTDVASASLAAALGYRSRVVSGVDIRI